MNLKKVLISSIVVSGLLLSAAPAFAHVVVKPNQAGVGAFQTFTIGVPVEKDVPTVGLRVVIPEGLNYVTPNVKPGWTIAVKKEGNSSADGAKITEISWTGGSIPAGQRDEFMFSAQVPAKETTVQWKAYQTYEDGTEVSWDKAPTKKEAEDGKSGPYSETKIVNDLKASNAASAQKTMGETLSKFPMLLSIVAVALSAAALVIAQKKK